jgi:hypothetical protein
MRLRYHDTCATALEDKARALTTANCGWNAKQKEVNTLREFLFGKAMEHRDKARLMIESHNMKKAKAADESEEVRVSGV